MSSVIDTLECPSTSETIFGWTPFVSNRVAQVCLRSWKRTSHNPALFNLFSDPWGFGSLPRASLFARPPIVVAVEVVGVAGLSALVHMPSGTMLVVCCAWVVVGCLLL